MSNICGKKLTIPVVGAPLFIISNPKMVIAQCIAGIVGSFPALNARPESQLDEWLDEITSALAKWDQEHPDQPAAPFAVNQIVHKTNKRLDHDLALCERYKVPLIISSLGAVEEVNQAAHGFGAIVFHDIIHNRFAHKAIEKGADGLIAVAYGAGGHAGQLSPFALMNEIRSWFSGPLLLSGSIVTGRDVAAACMMGADYAYIGTPFIATEEARAKEAYKQMLVDSTANDILYTDYFSGVYGSYLRPSIEQAGLDPDALPEKPNAMMDLSKVDQPSDKPKPWRDVWSAGQGVGSINKIVSCQQRVDQLRAEYAQAIQEFKTNN